LAAAHMFNMNTVEATLLGSCVFVCLSGIMFQSGRFEAKEFQSQRDTLTFCVIFLVITTLIYAITVFVSDILAVLKPNCCNKNKRKKKIILEEQITGKQEKRPELQQNPLFHKQKKVVGNMSFPSTADHLDQQQWDAMRDEYARVYGELARLRAEKSARLSDRKAARSSSSRGEQLSKESASSIGVGGDMSPASPGAVVVSSAHHSPPAAAPGVSDLSDASPSHVSHSSAVSPDGVSPVAASPSSSPRMRPAKAPLALLPHLIQHVPTPVKPASPVGGPRISSSSPSETETHPLAVPSESGAIDTDAIAIRIPPPRPTPMPFTTTDAPPSTPPLLKMVKAGSGRSRQRRTFDLKQVSGADDSGKDSE
jgi:hypothetical protein